VGSEKRWSLGGETELFTNARIGVTAVSFSYQPDSNWPSVFPTAGLTWQLEAGLQKRHFCISAYFDAISLQVSSNLHVRGRSEINRMCPSQSYEAGAKFGFCY
jgi:hypothetical protein